MNPIIFDVMDGTGLVFGRLKNLSYWINQEFRKESRVIARERFGNVGLLFSSPDRTPNTVKIQVRLKEFVT